MNTTKTSLSIEQMDSVELIVEKYVNESNNDTSLQHNKSNNTYTEHPNITSVPKGKYLCNRFGSMISISSLFMVIVDILILYGMIAIYLQAKLANIANNSTVVIDPANITISVLCLISTFLFLISIQMVRLSHHNRHRLWIFIYIISMIIHSFLLHYEANIISNMQHYRTQCDTSAYNNCIDITFNLNIISNALQIKTVLLTMLFIAIFAYRIYIRLRLSQSTHFKRFYFCILIVISFCLLLSIVDVFFNDGFYIHGIAILFGLLYAKCHLCCCCHTAQHDNGINIDGQHLTETYENNATGTCDDTILECCYPAGCGIDCISGCCEWNTSHPENCCVVCGHICCNCCSDGVSTTSPDSIFFSCCGMCTCYCCDPGGCMDCACCSFDCFTWCCC